MQTSSIHLPLSRLQPHANAAMLNRLSGPCMAARPGAQRRLCSCAAAAADQPEVLIKPAYNKYRSKNDIDLSNIRRWKELSATDVELPDQSLWSTLEFIPGYIKYYVIPEPLRYLLFCICSAIMRRWYPYHKKLVIKGASLDAYLKQKGHPEQPAPISKSIALRRFHWNMSLWENLRYRFSLVKGAIATSFLDMKQHNLKQTEGAGMSPPAL